MHGTLLDDVISAVIADVLKPASESIYGFYEKPPGRRPSDQTKRISAAIALLEKQAAVEIIRDVVDRTIFSMLYLMDAEFKEYHIETIFRSHADGKAVTAQQLLDRYRSKVDPGGIIV